MYWLRPLGLKSCFGIWLITLCKWPSSLGNWLEGAVLWDFLHFLFQEWTLLAHHLDNYFANNFVFAPTNTVRSSVSIKLVFAGLPLLVKGCVTLKYTYVSKLYKVHIKPSYNHKYAPRKLILLSNAFYQDLKLLYIMYIRFTVFFMI